jgi:hypothetical protein
VSLVAASRRNDIQARRCSLVKSTELIVSTHLSLSLSLRASVKHTCIHDIGVQAGGDGIDDETGMIRLLQLAVGSKLQSSARNCRSLSTHISLQISLHRERMRAGMVALTDMLPPLRTPNAAFQVGD